ncbi:MAG: hypothetical protein J5737_03425 [Bacteroidales bacterium]|nr:hypothetical protein [Bacteroidales bacterium]
MKRLFVLAAALFAAASLAVSCNWGADLEDSSWEVYRVEEWFNGRVVASTDVVGGTLDVRGHGYDQTWYLKVPEIGVPGYDYEREDVSIVRSSSNELVIDMFYFEYDDVYREECDLYSAFKGVNIYKAYWYNSNTGKTESYFVYFKHNGNAVEVSGSWITESDDIWTDATRVYCRRR